MKVFLSRLTVLAVLLTGLVSAQDLPSGTFVGADDSHRGAGMFEVVETAEGRVLNFSEDFATARGPDLFVWLARGDDTDNIVNLGRLQSAQGAQTYTVPAEVDLGQYDRVLIWCRAFRFLFATAEFTPLE